MGLNGRQVPQWSRDELATVEGQLQAQREILESIQQVNDTASAKRAALLKSAFEWLCEQVDKANAADADAEALRIGRRRDDFDDDDPRPPMIEGHA